MTFSIYDLEADQERDTDSARLIFTVSSMFTMTVSYVFCAFVVSLILNGYLGGWLPVLTSVLKSVFMVCMMVVTATIIAYAFNNSTVRRLNSLILGMVMAFTLIFFNL